MYKSTMKETIEGQEPEIKRISSKNSQFKARCMKPVNNTQSRFKNSPVAVTILQRVTFVSYTVARCKIWNVARLYGLRVTSHHRRKIVGRRSWSVDTDFEAFDRFPSIDPSTDWSILARSGRLTNDRLELLDIGEMQLLLLVWIGNQGNVSD